MACMMIVSGYASRLIYRSLPPVPDHDIKDYLMGPINDHLKSVPNSRLITEKMAEWYVAQFGGNFADLERFIKEVLKEKVADEEAFLSQSMRDYMSEFNTAWDNPEAKVILDDLIKKESFDSAVPYQNDALTYLVKKNIVALHANSHTWNKPLVRIAYEAFVEEKKKP